VAHRPGIPPTYALLRAVWPRDTDVLPRSGGVQDRAGGARRLRGPGYGGARMTDIAEAAGVAVQTVYFTFHTKGKLLQACYETAVLGEEKPSIPIEPPWYAAMLAAEDGSAMLREFAAGNSGIATRVAGLDEVIHATRHEPDAVAVRQRSEVLGREGHRSTGFPIRPAVRSGSGHRHRPSAALWRRRRLSGARRGPPLGV